MNTGYAKFYLIRNIDNLRLQVKRTKMPQKYLKPFIYGTFVKNGAYFLINKPKNWKNAKGEENYIIIKLCKKRDFAA